MPLPTIRSARALSPYDFSSVSSTVLSNDAVVSSTAASSATPAKTRTRRTSLSITTSSSSSGSNRASATGTSSAASIDSYLDRAERPLPQREVTGMAIGDISGSTHGRLSDISRNRPPPASLLTLPHILTNKLSATKYIELAQHRLLGYQSNNVDMARDNAQLHAQSKQHTHERKVLSQRCKQLGELVRIYKARVDEVVEGFDRREQEREREKVEEETERAKVEERQRKRDTEMRGLRDRLDKMREELKEEKRMRRDEASQREEEDRERMEHSSNENERERILSVQVRQSTAEVQRLQQRLDELLREKEQADGREEQLRRASETQTDENDRERRQLQRDVSDKAQRLQQLTDARDKAITELALLSDEVRSSKLTADEMADRMHQLQESNERLQLQLQRLEEMRETYASQSEHVQRVAARLVESEQARDELSQLLDDSEVELAVTREELEGTEGAYRQLSGSYSKLRAVVVQLSEELKGVRASMASMRDEGQKRQQQLSATEQQLHPLTDTQHPTRPPQHQRADEHVFSQLIPATTVPSTYHSEDAEEAELCRLWDMQMRVARTADDERSRVPFISAAEVDDERVLVELHQRVGAEASSGKEVLDEDDDLPLN